MEKERLRPRSIIDVWYEQSEDCAVINPEQDDKENEDVEV